MEWDPIILTFRLAAISTFLLFFLSLPLSYWLAFTKNQIKPFIEALVSMPLVLPPTVLGFYLLIAFSPNNEFGQFLENYLGFRLVFSFQGLVLGSIIYSLPFMVHPIQSGFSNLPRNFIETAQMLGKSRWTTFTKILLPNIKSSLLTGLVLSFAHTIGEFGLVLMIGGNIPRQTKVASIAIYEEVEALNYAAANVYSLFLFVVSFLILLLVYLTNGDYLKSWFANKASPKTYKDD